MRRAAAGAVALFLGFGLMWFGSDHRTPAGHRESSQTISAAYVQSARDDSAFLARDAELQRLETERLDVQSLETERVAREREAREAEEQEEARAFALAAEKARQATRAVVTTPTTVRAAPVARTPVSESAGGDAATWAALSQCESENTNADTGNGYSGYIQFSDSTWRSLGYAGRAVDHDYATQIQAGRELQARSGWGQWPACSRQLGLR